MASQILKDMDFLATSYWKSINHPSVEDRLNETAFNDRADSDINSFIMKIVRAAENQNYDGEIEGWTYSW